MRPQTHHPAIWKQLAAVKRIPDGAMDGSNSAHGVGQPSLWVSEVIGSPE